MYGKLLAEVYFRLDNAMKAFFHRAKAGEKPGFPRSRRTHGLHCAIPRCAWKYRMTRSPYQLEEAETGVLNVIQTFIAHLTEQPPNHFHEVAVSRDACGKYYCSFVYEDAENSDDDRKVETNLGGEKRTTYPTRYAGIVAFDLGIKTLATGVNDQGRFYHIGGFKGYRWYNRQLDKIRSKRDRCKKKSRRYIHLSNVYKRVSERKRRKQRDCLHKASHLIAHQLAERAVVIGDLSQRQMVIKEKDQEIPIERHKRRIRNRMVYNDWGLYGFVQMLTYKCLRFGKELYIISERDTTKTCHACKQMQAMPLWKRTYRCQNCDLVMDRDENSALNIYQRFLARPGPHTHKECGVLHGLTESYSNQM